MKKKPLKNLAEKMNIQLRIEVIGDARVSNHFRDGREDVLELSRSQAAILMDELEKVVENFTKVPNKIIKVNYQK